MRILFNEFGNYQIYPSGKRFDAIPEIADMRYDLRVSILKALTALGYNNPFNRVSNDSDKIELHDMNSINSQGNIVIDRIYPTLRRLNILKSEMIKPPSATPPYK